MTDVLHIMAGRRTGGAETYAVDMMLSLQRDAGGQMSVLHHRNPRYHEVCAALQVDSATLRWPIKALQRARLRRLIEKHKPLIIHAWMRRAASLLPSGLSCPVIGWFGGYYDPRNFRHCTHFIGVTPDIVKHMLANGVPENRAFYVPTFPDVRHEKPIERASLDTADDAFVVLVLARLHPKKGLDTMLRALLLLPENAVLWLAGEGELRDELHDLAARLGVMHKVRFLGWRTDRGALLRTANVCVIPSRYEPFGTVILEAWVAGTPLVATRSAGPRATVEDEKNGLLVSIDNESELAAAIKRIHDDSELAKSLIAAGMLRYQQDFTRETVTNRMRQVYATCLPSNQK